MLIKSDDVARLLSWHIENGAYFDPDLLIGTMEDVVGSDEYDTTTDEAIESKRISDFIRDLSEKYVDIIKTPSPFSTKIIFDLIGKMSETFGSEVLEQCLLIKKINEVPGISERAMQVRPVVVKQRPNSKIYYYYEQCINCYINGLIEASSVMARSVLEYSLREKLKTNKVAYISFIKGNDSLNSLIETCKNNRLLTIELAEKAHTVKNKGNYATHKRVLDINEVKLQIDLLGEVLEHLYK